MLKFRLDCWGNRIVEYSGPAGVFMIPAFKLSGIDRLSLNRQTFAGADIKFLLKCTFLKGILIRDWKLHDRATIEHMTHLRSLYLSTPEIIGIDLTRFDGLDELGTEFWTTVKNLSQARYLTKVFGVGCPDQDLEKFSNLELLQHLDLRNTKISSLNGIPKDNLKNVEINGARFLEDLEAISECSSLEKVSLISVPKINSIYHLCRLRALKELVMIDCGSIETVNPIFTLLKLEKLILVGNTKVADGDLQGLLQIPSLKECDFVEFKHYNITRSEMLEAIENKNGESAQG